MLWNSYVSMLKKLNPNVTFREGHENNFSLMGVYIMQDDPNWVDTGDIGSPRKRAQFLFGANRDWIPDRNQMGEDGVTYRRGWKDSIVDMYLRGFVVNKEYYRRLTDLWRPHPLP